MRFTLYGRATRNFLMLLVLMHLVLFLDRLNLAAAASVMQKDLGLSNIALGVAFSAFNYSYAPFQMVGGWFADRFGARRTLTICGSWWSLTTIATAAVTGLASLFMVRLVLGMGRGRDVASRHPGAVEMDLARFARHRDRHHPLRRPRRPGDDGADRRLPDSMVFLALLVHCAGHCVGRLGGPMVAVLLR